MKRCLRDCYKNHEICTKLRKKLLVHRLPKYLIDLESIHNGYIRIVDTEGIQEDNVHYSILSYSWGGDQDSKSTSGNLKKRLVGFPLTDLPMTVRHAVIVTQAFGLCYLWVDAICIQQDSDGRLIQQELDAMPELYAKATVVISAACAAHSDAGFLEPRDQNYHQYDLPVSTVDEGQQVDSRITLFERGFKKQREPVDMRIWTEQERNNALCSFRFESEQVVWRCRETTHADSDVDMLPPHPDAYNASTFDGSMFPSMLSTTSTRNYEANLREYLKHTSDFSKRQYTSFDDRLDAFARSASFMARDMGWEASQYKAGLWMKDMQRGLMWCRDERWTNGSTAGVPMNMTLVPSWSWASLPSAVQWDDLNYLDWGSCYSLRVSECKVKVKCPKKPYHGVEKGELTVEGYALNVFWDGRELVNRTGLCGSVRRASRPTLEPGAFNNPQGPSLARTHDKEERKRSHESAFPSDHQVSLEPSVLPAKVIWDSLLPPEPQDLTCLEILGFGGSSSGIMLSYTSGGKYKRSGYFTTEDEIRGGPLGGGSKVGHHWLRQGRCRKFCVI